MSYNLFLDDYRDPKCLKDTRAWVVVRGYNDFVNMITYDGMPSFISFDHDLSFEHYPTDSEREIKAIDYNDPRYSGSKTGYHCALWLIDYCKKKNLPLPKWQIHSMNPVGRANIYQLLKRYEETQNL